MGLPEIEEITSEHKETDGPIERWLQYAGYEAKHLMIIVGSKRKTVCNKWKILFTQPQNFIRR
jgi:hypothetical protein